VPLGGHLRTLAQASRSTLSVDVARLFAIAVALAVVAGTVAGDVVADSSPKRAAAALWARVQAEGKHEGALGVSPVVSRGGNLWLAVGDTFYTGKYDAVTHARVRVYRWSGSAWELDGTVRGSLSPTQWIYPAALTGSRDPDFAIEGCGAADTICFSVVSDIGGHWHGVPFEYGYGRTLEVNGMLAGHHLVETMVDACSCAAGPTTTLYERYRHGVFIPTDPPGGGLGCTPTGLTTVAYPYGVQILRFGRVACADGWALAVGTGMGYAGRVLGLFDLGIGKVYTGQVVGFGDRGARAKRWALLTLDDGNALPVAPAVYDLPLTLFLHLAARLGPALAPQVGAAKLIGRLQSHYGFSWAQQNGIVDADGTRWLIAVVPTVRAPKDDPYPVAAIMYRWDDSRWTAVGRIPRLRYHLNVNWSEGWFVSVPTKSPSSVAFELVGSCCNARDPSVLDAHSTGVITNAGGTWHLAPLR